MKVEIVLLITGLLCFYSCKEDNPELPSVISQEQYAGVYEASRLQYAGSDSFGQFIHDTLFYKLVNDTVLLQIRTDSIFLSGSNMKHQYVNSGNADSIRFERSLSAAHYEVHGYTRDLDSLMYYSGSTGDFSSAFKGEKL